MDFSFGQDEFQNSSNGNGWKVIDSNSPNSQSFITVQMSKNIFWKFISMENDNCSNDEDGFGDLDKCLMNLKISQKTKEIKPPKFTKTRIQELNSKRLAKLQNDLNNYQNIDLSGSQRSKYEQTLIEKHDLIKAKALFNTKIKIRPGSDENNSFKINQGVPISEKIKLQFKEYNKFLKEIANDGKSGLSKIKEKKRFSQPL